jgi:hypothetical protein
MAAIDLRAVSGAERMSTLSLMHSRFVMVLALVALAGCASSESAAPIVAAPSLSSKPSYFVGGRVTGLKGVGLVLRTAAGDHARVMADGEFAFGTPFENGARYAITIEREPISPVQSCVVEHASGKIAGKEPSDIVVTCSTVSFDDPPATDERRASN